MRFVTRSESRKLISEKKRRKESIITWDKVKKIVDEFAEGESPLAYIDDFEGEMSANMQTTIFIHHIVRNDYKGQIFVRNVRGLIFLDKRPAKTYRRYFDDEPSGIVDIEKLQQEFAKYQ